MDNYIPNIHHRKSIRLQGYDYSKAGLYFITICIQDRKCLFGNIMQENIVDPMVLNDAGKIADECWLAIPKHFPNAILHEHIIMPNHVHGIIELVKNDNTGVQNDDVGVQNFEPLQKNVNKFQKIIPHSIGSIVRGYKIGVTKWFRSNTDIKFVWQRNYYENIIRTEKSYQRIREYIINNAKNWHEDKFFS
jgi:REP element-mobilizing transposase RayT